MQAYLSATIARKVSHRLVVRPLAWLRILTSNLLGQLPEHRPNPISCHDIPPQGSKAHTRELMLQAHHHIISCVMYADVRPVEILSPHSPFPFLCHILAYSIRTDMRSLQVQKLCLSLHDHPGQLQHHPILFHNIPYLGVPDEPGQGNQHSGDHAGVANHLRQWVSRVEHDRDARRARKEWGVQPGRGVPSGQADTISKGKEAVCSSQGST